MILLISFAGCKKLVTVASPDTEITSENIYTDDATAASVLTGIYISLNSNTPLLGTTLNGISLVSGLSADEFTLFGSAANGNSVLVQYYLNRLVSGSSTSSLPSIWSNCYSDVYIVNIALERLSISNSLTPAVKQQLMGEAKFLRAFFYFYLVNLYGKVPLVTTSNYADNATLSRNSPDQVYQQIISDLTDAKSLLSDGYVGSDAMSATDERVRPNRWTATALLARAYLYTRNWDSAEAMSSLVINHTALYRLDSLNGVFLKNSTEAIWQLQPVNAGWNTEDARVFVIPPTGPTSNSSTSGFPVYLSSQLINSFETGDWRRMNWVDSVTVNGSSYYYPYKYKSATLNNPVTEYLIVFRLGEQYLIRAEARTMQGTNLSGASDDLNAIRARAGLGIISSGDQSTLIVSIQHERQMELFTEWGNRWLDLKRTGNIDAVMDTVAIAKGTSWNSNWQFYPVPLYDDTQDPNLGQNSGYGSGQHQGLHVKTYN